MVAMWFLLFACSEEAPRKEAAAPAEKVERKEEKKEARKEKRAGDDDDDDDDDEGSGKPLASRPFQPQADPCAAWAEPGTYAYPLTFDGKDYEIPVYIGESTGPRDMVVLLHGGKGSARSILKKSRFHDKALADGFVAVAPDGMDLGGMGRRWNTGKFDKELEEMLPPDVKLRDDVAFLDAVSGALRKDVCARHVMAVGFSSGGQMAHAWACKGTQVDGVMSAAGSLLVADKTCNKPTPVLGVVGSRDDVYTKSPNENDPTQPSAPETVELWAKTNRCERQRTESTAQDATCYTYQGCAAPTQLCVVKGLPHAYPAPWGEGDKASEFNATEYGWRWFQASKR
jgi:poly(3-hydroxybutyrate) depolymerase